MESRDKVELAIRSAHIAYVLLGLTETNSILHTKSVIQQAERELVELIDKVDAINSPAMSEEGEDAK